MIGWLYGEASVVAELLVVEMVIEVVELQDEERDAFVCRQKKNSNGKVATGPVLASNKLPDPGGGRPGSGVAPACVCVDIDTDIIDSQPLLLLSSSFNWTQLYPPFLVLPLARCLWHDYRSNAVSTLASSAYFGGGASIRWHPPQRSVAMASPYSSMSSAPGGLHSNIPSSTSSIHSNSTASHREIYENERTRIQQSCFSRADADGQLLECYITHVRVIEDAVHPSAPPPHGYQAAPGARKNRVIIVAVRKSGRVRLHKARENQNGSFSIGKSWYLDDLTQIEDDTGCTGFTATIGKPYYWQTRTTKEKDAFVASLFRIFKKYTGGKTPALLGFDSITAMIGEGRPSTASSDMFQTDQTNGEAHTPVATPSLPSSQVEHARQLSTVSTQSSQPSIQSTGDTESAGRSELQSKASDNSVRPRIQRTPTNESTRQQAPQAAPETRPSEQVAFESSLTVSAGESFGGDSVPPDHPKQRKPLGPAGLPTSPRGGNGNATKARHMFPIQTNIETPSSVSQAPNAHASSPQAPQAPPIPSTPTAATAPAQARGPMAAALANKNSVNNIRNRFKLAADAYAAGGALGGSKRPPQAPHPIATNVPAVTGPTTPVEPQLERPAIRDLKNASNERLMVRVSISKEDLLRGKLGSISGPSSGPSGPSQESSVTDNSTRRAESPAMQNAPESRKGTPTVPEVTIVERSTATPEVPPIPLIDISGTTDAVGEPAPSIMKNGSPEPPVIAAPEKPLPTPEKDTNKNSLLSVKHKRRRSTAANSARSKYMSQIDIANLTVDIDNVLEDFGWDGREMKIDALEHEIRQELAKVESGNIWIATDEENKAANHTRIDELARQLDETLAQCDELDGLLTLYAVELMSLQDDIAYIENQSQGLQVQTANQKTLLKELEILLQTVSISPEEIETLQNSKVQADNLPDIESSLSIIYKAIITIDPTATANAGNRRASGETEVEDVSLGEVGMGKMMALRDKKDKYVEDSKTFGRRLIEYMKIKYRQDMMMLVKQETVAPTGKSGSKTPATNTRPKAASHMAMYHSLYKFAGLILFIHDVDKNSYNTLMKEYTVASKEQFSEEIQNHIWGWRAIMRKPTPEDQEILFTHSEKEPEGAAARGLGVMRSATRAKPFRSTASDGGPKATGEKIQDGKLTGSECFGGFIDEIIPLVAAEQNFLSEFFHISSQIQTFLEFVQTGHPDDRRPTDLNRRRAPELDKHISKKLADAMSEIFGFLSPQIQSFVGTITSNDPLQGVGVIYAVEKKLSQFREGTNQEFLVKLLLKLNEQMKGSFINFLKEQVRAIEATKVKSKKKRAVLDFIKSFPLFSAKIEDQLPPEQLSDESLEVRDMVNNGYSILNRAMFDAMQAIAKQTPSSAGNAQSVDPDDKEALYYHIMIIQNTVYYTDALDVRNNSVLQDFKQKAEDEYKEHMSLYVSAVIRKYLEKTLDFVEGVEALEQTSTPEEILGKKSYNKLKFKEILSDHQKEISGSHVRDGVKQLVKRVTKHFGDEGHLDPLSVRVLKEAEAEYLRLVNRMNGLLQGTYRDQGLEMPLKREDVTAAFARQMSVK
ncbi:hypothetical protein Dda_1323 [Drechslerella dactyloides]|uniref:Exocyst complex component Sec3 PIP2-binding N-terminal domain-containing protein n=1 Tax=Drechslerella dactyloides TaxID=74499 RepID=A0AAD6NKH8_DREDA|nr:hypothetical protein Dda_1323 [Drechslerella dactyloides]